MTKISKKYLFWICVISLIFMFGIFASNAIRPFIISFILSYLFIPIINKAEKLKISRSLSSGVIVLLFFTVFILIFSFLFPFLYEKIMFFAQDFISNSTISDSKITKISKLLHVEEVFLRNLLANIQNTIGNFQYKIITQYPNKTIHIAINLIATIFVMPIIMFYTMKDWRKITQKIYELMPIHNRQIFSSIIREIDISILFYLRGQLNVCLFFGIFYSILLHICGLNFGFLMGIAVGILIFIPYIGFLIGCSIALVVAFLQFGTGGQFMLIAGIFLLGQLIDANYTTPKFVGNKIGLHPVWIVFGLFASSSLFGITGAIFALPITTSAAILIKYLFAKYKNSHYYR